MNDLATGPAGNPLSPPSTNAPSKMTPYSVEWWNLWSDRLRLAAVVGSLSVGFIGVYVTPWSDRLKSVVVVGGLLVGFIGAVGWYVTLKASKLKDEVSKKARLESDAAIAIAYAVAEEAKKGAAIANEGQAKANKAAAEANKAAAEAAEKAAALEKDAAKARIELEKLRKNVSWRSLSDAEFQQLTYAFRHWNGKTIAICNIIGDYESLNIRNVLVEAAKRAGVVFSDKSVSQVMYNVAITGFRIHTRERDYIISPGLERLNSNLAELADRIDEIDKTLVSRLSDDQFEKEYGDSKVGIVVGHKSNMLINPA